MPPPLPDEQAALLRAIIESPDDDTPRLVYADWLHEHGDEEQAECIRGSIELDALSQQAPERKPLAKKLAEVQRARGYDWLEALGIELVGDIYFSRGLPNAVTYYGLGAFLEDAEAVFARLPINRLLLHWEGGRTDSDDLEAFAALPGLARIDDLTLMSCNDLQFCSWEAVIESPYLRAREFGIVNCAFEDKEARAIAACPNLSRLTTLHLSSNALGPEGALAIVQSPHLKNVTALSFAENTGLEGYDDEESELDREPYLELVAALTARFGNADALTTWLR